MSWFHVLAVVGPTVAVSLVVRWMSRKSDAVLLMSSGIASLVLAIFAGGAMQGGARESMMTLQMSPEEFRLGILSPVLVVATLAIMRGLFRFMQP